MPVQTPTNGDSFNKSELIQTLNKYTENVKAKIDRIRSEGGNISIPDMFDLQMMMNTLSQLSEMSGAVVGASNGAIIALARKVSG